ncbi:MAG: hypothetical protein FMNOHCHN_03366 [Ignavibacteriaceae bacterium]|nr:hypothetical protein [Ignavibacteriaceae bacterium]
MTTPKIENILLDMDGVLADFFSDSLLRLNKKFRSKESPITIEEYLESPSFDMAQKFGISAGEFWTTIESDQYFWRNMTPFSWAKQLYEFLQRFAPVTICSSPSLNPRCIPDKLEWISKHLNIKSDQCMFGGRKHLMAKPNALLIDDYPKNVDKFIEAGGNAVLVPSSWNTKNLTFNDVLEKIVKYSSLGN